jgi:uncharacterized membrane protein
MSKIQSPSEVIENATFKSHEDRLKALKLKTDSAIYGAFWGGALGLVFAFYKQKNKYVCGLVGAVIGGVVSNILTVNNEKENV